MNPLLARLNPYPFEKLRALTGGKPAGINLSVGEPKHPTPQFIKDALCGALDGLSAYPATAVLPLVGAERPGGGFYVWLKTPIDDTEFVRRLHHEYNVLVLPGSYLGRQVRGENPGRNHVRIALVAPLGECIEAAKRIRKLL